MKLEETSKTLGPKEFFTGSIYPIPTLWMHTYPSQNVLITHLVLLWLRKLQRINILIQKSATDPSVPVDITSVTFNLTTPQVTN